MKRYFLPSVSGLVAFESVARHGSVTTAATELNLTQSAVSRQIRQLESFLDIELFRRIHQRVLLTEAGRQYLNDVSRLLQEMTAATKRVVTRGESSAALKIGLAPTLATRWLVPRLPGFLAAHPSLQLEIVSRNESASDLESIDAAIVYDVPYLASASIHHLMKDEMVPVCSPKFLNDHVLRTPQDLLGFGLLHQNSRPWAWPEWFNQTGVSECHASRGFWFDEFSTVAEAAMEGMGIALLPKFLIGQELRTGKLLQPLQQALCTDRAYHLVISHSKASLDLVQSFKAWMCRQAQTEQPLVRTTALQLEGELLDQAVTKKRDRELESVAFGNHRDPSAFPSWSLAQRRQ